MRGNLLKLETDVIIENATNEGRAEKRENGIRIMISNAIEDQLPIAKLLNRLCTNYSLSQDQAEAYIRKYTQN